MKILVAGGAGFAGSNYILYVQENHPEDEIICYDLKEKPATLTNVTYIQGDICDKDKVYKTFEEIKPDYVVNFASKTVRSKELSELVDTNVTGTSILLDACNLYGIKQFHQASTDEVYGDLPLGKTDFYFSEKSELRPVTPYGATKAAADMLVLSYFDAFKMNVTISRAVNVYGPKQDSDKLIPSLINQALNDEELPVYGKGIDVRDWIHVDDYCEAIDRILRNGTAGEVYNVGSHNEIRNIFIVRIILNETNKPETLISYRENRRGKERRRAIDYSKIESELGWSPQVEFKDGIKQTIEWYASEKKN